MSVKLKGFDIMMPNVFDKSLMIADKAVTFCYVSVANTDTRY